MKNLTNDQMASLDPVLRRAIEEGKVDGPLYLAVRQASLMVGRTRPSVTIIVNEAGDYLVLTMDEMIAMQDAADAAGTPQPETVVCVRYDRRRTLVDYVGRGNTTGEKA